MFLSIDIGGSKTLLALFTSLGFCLKRLRFETYTHPTDFLSALQEHLLLLLPSSSSRSKIKAITVALPGVVHSTDTYVQFKLGNLNWEGLDLLSPLRTFFPESHPKIFFVNDADLATLYEASRLFRRYDKTVYLTFSTGIGGGLAKKGSLLPSSAAFEPGHTKYQWNKKTLEWEDIASAKALSEAYASPLIDLPLDRRIKDDLISRLVIGLVDIIKTESPSLLIIGGPLGLIINQLKTPLLKAIKTSAVAKDLPENLISRLKIKRALRPTESVIYGAYLFSKQNYRR